MIIEAPSSIRICQRGLFKLLNNVPVGIIHYSQHRVLFCVSFLQKDLHKLILVFLTYYILKKDARTGNG